MNDRALARFAASRFWPPYTRLEHESQLRYVLDVELGFYVCATMPAYAECGGPADPFCGRCRFSVHGCNGAPSRAEFVEWVRRTGAVLRQRRGVTPGLRK